jgi:hypothetical protein
MWIGVWTLLFSLMAPLASLQAADAAILAAQDDQQCDPGLVLDQ